MAVSKKWASIVREKKFRDAYFLQSMKKPRVVFEFRPNDTDVMFHSVYQEEKPLLSSGQQQIRLASEQGYCYPPSIRGIYLCRGTQVALCNPFLKKFLTLPELPFRERSNFGEVVRFGYDEAKDEFKLLCFKAATDYGPYGGDHEYHVLTVGEASWRPVVCKSRLHVQTGSICNRGVLYYGAKLLPEIDPVLVCFDFRSEEFTVIELPEEAATLYLII